MLLDRYKKVMFLLLIVAIMLTVYYSERYLSRRRKLKEEILNTLRKLDHLQKNVFTKGFSDTEYDRLRYKKYKNEMDKNWNATLTKYIASKSSRNETIRKYTDSDSIRNKTKNIALDQSNLSPQKKAELRHIRNEKRKQILMSKVMKIQDSIAKYTFKLKSTTEDNNPIFY